MAAAPVYSAAKAGVVSFTRSLASLAGDSGIRVNAICPALVDTPLALAMGEEVIAGLRASQSVLTPKSSIHEDLPGSSGDGSDRCTCMSMPPGRTRAPEASSSLRPRMLPPS